MIRSDLALAALASAAVPGMRPVSVAAIRTGEDSQLHQSALVEDVTGRRWLVRSPLGAAAGAELERNDDLVRQLGKHLPFKVPAAAGYADLGADGRAVVYPYVEGLALSLRHLPVGPGLASAVGRAIAAVHNMPREVFEEHAVPVFSAGQFRARRLAGLDRAAETGHVPHGLLARWEQALEAAPMWEFTTVPTHGSLDGAAFLVVFSDDDAASGRVVGLTGWERAQVADPADDFALLVEQANPRAVDAVFESYAMARSQRPDGYLLHRARLASEMRLLTGLAAAVGAGDEGFVRRRADELRKLDRLTSNDDTLVPRTALHAPPSQPAAPESVAEPDVDRGSDTAEQVTDPNTTAPVPRLPGNFPDEATQDEATQNEATQNEATQDEAPLAGETSEETAPEETAPEEIAPEETAPEETPPEPTPAGPVTSALAAEDADLLDEDHPADDTQASAEKASDEQSDGDDEQTDSDDEPAVVVEAPAEGTHLEPAHPTHRPVSAAGLTAPIPMFHPVQAAAEPVKTDDPDEAPASPDAENASDESAVEDADHTPDDGGTDDGGTDDGGTDDGGTDDGETDDGETDDGETDDSETDDGASGQEQDEAERDRLHTLYGMPEADDLDRP